jgi:asparagine synthetase B (glutamine-hydrolysing)
MCGLTLSIHPYPVSSSHESLHESLCQTCKARGPDTQSTYSSILDGQGGSRIELRLSASVLGLRGEITRQPIVGKRGVLGWNGQVGPNPHIEIYAIAETG